jgi:cytochrome P450
VKGDMDELSQAVTTVLAIVDHRFMRVIQLPSWLPLPENRRMKEALTRLDGIIQGFIDERRRSGEDKGDLLSMLLMAQTEDGSSMTDKQLRDESTTLFGAGHETTANALTWTWYLLSQHPEVEAKLHEELDTVLSGRVPTYADLPNLPYTEMVIKESMRLYPPAWTTSRQTVEEVTINGQPIEKGKIVLLNFWSMHRDPRYFKDPETFDPERFSAERESEIPKHAYLPFGAGPRVCIGNAFAMMEARLVLATLAQRYTLLLAPDQVVQPARFFTLRPKYGMQMVIHARETVRV